MGISVAKMVKRFGGTEVLRGIDLDVREGELIALLGPSGSGKTTLLKIIAGLDWPDAGTLTVEGEDWLAIRPQDRRTGFVFQHYALFPHMTVQDNIAFGLTIQPRASRPPARDIARKVSELLEFLQIPQLAKRYPSELSGGQRQRVALGRALAIGPKVLLLDEPFGALDAAVRRDLRRWLRDVHDRTGTTTIFVTHDQEEAFELADRVVVMGAGRIEQVGTADEIFDQPASPFVARFMGATTELPVTSRDGRLQAPGLDLSAIPNQAEGAATLFLRPGDIALDPDGTSPFVVRQVVSSGTHRRITVDGAGDLLEAELPRSSPPLATGDRVRLSPRAGHIFPTPSKESAS